jgi:hypothetical protein
VQFSTHALGQPITIGTRQDLQSIQVWLGGTGTAHVSFEPLVADPLDPTAAPLPDDAHRLLSVDVALDSATATATTVTPARPVRIDAGTYAVVVDPPLPASLAWSACGAGGGFMRSDDQVTWSVVAAAFAAAIDVTEPDVTPPTPTIAAAPAFTNADHLTLAIGADEPARFTCALDGNAVPCGDAGFATGGAVALAALAAGDHAVTVTAEDAMGNVSPIPASTTFTVDRTPPTITLAVTAPRAGSHRAVLALSTNEQATFACALDGGAPGPCADGDAIDLPTEGSHTITATATDRAGNTSDPVLQPVLADWTAPTLVLSPDITVEATTIDGMPVTFDASATDALDPAPTVVCDPASGTTFDVGDTTVSCTATDAAQNVATGSLVVHVTPPPITSAELDVVADITDCTFAVTEPDGGTIDRPDDATAIAHAAGHVLVATVDVRHRADDEGGDARGRLRLGSLAYDGAPAHAAGRNEYRCRITTADDGTVDHVTLRLRTPGTLVVVRYRPATDSSLVLQVDRTTGATLRVERRAGAFVPHLRTIAGHLLIVTGG